MLDFERLWPGGPRTVSVREESCSKAGAFMSDPAASSIDIYSSFGCECADSILPYFLSPKTIFLK
jgi:hypothetical protein